MANFVEGKTGSYISAHLLHVSVEFRVLGSLVVSPLYILKPIDTSKFPLEIDQFISYVIIICFAHHYLAN